MLTKITFGYGILLEVKSDGILVGIKLDALTYMMLVLLNKGITCFKFNLWDKQLKTKWNLLIAYAAAQEENKLAFLAELSYFCSVNIEPILTGGDFSIIHAKERNKAMRAHKFL